MVGKKATPKARVGYGKTATAAQMAALHQAMMREEGMDNRGGKKSARESRAESMIRRMGGTDSDKR